MTNFGRLLSLTLLFSLQLGHTQTPATPNCTNELMYPAIDGTKALVLVKPRTELEALAANTTIEIMKNKMPGVLGFEREEQQKELAIQGGRLLAKEILKIQGLNNEQATVEAVMVISTLGHVPKNALDGFADILTKNVSSLEAPKEKDVEFNKETSNALGELTRVVTNYRKSAFDVNGLAKLMFWLGLKKQSDYVRNNFQSVKEAAERIDDTLETALAHMIMRHYQMLDGRIQLKDLERYAELSTMMGQEAQRLLEEYAAESNFNEVQKAAFIKNAVTPLSNRIIELVKMRTVMSLSYAQFTLLMDGNLSLISMISNIRETARLEITVFGAAKVAIEEMKEIENMGNAARDAFSMMRAQTVEELKQFGIRQRLVPDREIKSIEQAITQADQLDNELQVAQDFRTVTLQKRKDALAIIIPKLEAIAARADQGVIPKGDLNSIIDKDLEATGVKREAKDLNGMPTLIAPPNAAAAN